MSELPSLFIANSKISLFLKKNLPLDHPKKFTCMHSATLVPKYDMSPAGFDHHRCKTTN
jgi:hypothetical protein